MGKVAIADDSLWSYCKQYNPSKGYVLGLILGQSSKGADYVVHLARIPPPDNAKNSKGPGAGEDDPKPKTSSSNGLSLTDIKESWVSNHACDVTRMLPGGMWILGLFLIGLDDPFQNQANCSHLRSILRHMRTELKKKPFYHGDSPTSEKLVLHVNVPKNLVSCRSVDLDGSSFRQMEWKFQMNPTVWKKVESILDLHHTWHLKREESSKELRSQLQTVLEAVSDQVNDSVCLLAHELRDPEDSLESIFKKRKMKSSKRKSGKADDEELNNTITANLYMPMAGIKEVKATSGVELSNGSGIMYFIGSPLSRVFVHQKATIDETCRAVKEDIIRSIAARLEMHADSLVEEDPSPSEEVETLHEPPRRVMIKLPSTNVTFSDYLFPGEGPEEALVSSEDLLDLKLELEDVEQDVEVIAESVVGSDWTSDEKEVERGSDPVASQGNVNYLLILMGAVVLALISFLIQMFLRSSHNLSER